MLDVAELEKKWSSYHLKKMLPRYIILGTMSIASAIASYLFLIPSTAFTNAPSQTSVQKEALVAKIAEDTTPKVPKNIINKSLFTSQNVLSPSFSFTVDLDKELLTYNNALILASVSQRKKKKTEPVHKTKKKKELKKRVKKNSKKKPIPKKKVAPAKVAKPAVKKKPKQITAKKSPAPKSIILGEKSNVIAAKDTSHAILQNKKTTDSQLASVIKRFKHSKKPALGLFIANKYYINGDYKSSYKYAKATYKINPNIEDAVLLYAKSLAKLGHKDKAIARLKPYIKKSGSIEAKALLNNLNKGLFK